jgi:hypothetical protein
MPTVEAEVRTERASRYLVQFCRHAAGMGAGRSLHARRHGGSERGAAEHGAVEPGAAEHGVVERGAAEHDELRARADWTDTHGVVTFTPGGVCTMDADATTLTIRVHAGDELSLRRIQGIVTRDLDRFSSREPLTVAWRPAEPAQ